MSYRHQQYEKKLEDQDLMRDIHRHQSTDIFDLTKWRVESTGRLESEHTDNCHHHRLLLSALSGYNHINNVNIKCRARF